MICGYSVWSPECHFGLRFFLPAAATTGVCMTCLQLADAFTKLLVGSAADRAIASGSLSVLEVRKLLSCSGFLGFAAALVACSLLSDWRFVTAALAVGKGFSSLHAPGFKTNYLDLTTRDVGSLMGVGNSAATLSSTVAPMIAGVFVENFGWSAMFQMSAAVTASGAIVFGVFASASNLDARDHGGKSQ